MTDAQMLQNLLAVYETMVRPFNPENYQISKYDLKEVITELRRRTAEDESHARLSEKRI